MNIVIFERPYGTTIAREDASGGEFFLREDGSVWYRNSLANDVLFVNADESTFRDAVFALHRYNTEVANVAGESGQMLLVRKFAADLRALGVPSGPTDSFWPTITEQTEQGML